MEEIFVFRRKQGRTNEIYFHYVEQGRPTFTEGHQSVYCTRRYVPQAIRGKWQNDLPRNRGASLRSQRADTRMITHAGHACQDHSTIVIKSPDTDVFFIALNACLEIDANLLFETSVGNRKRIISLYKIRQHFGDQWCCALIGLHAFTGNLLYTQLLWALRTV